MTEQTPRIEARTVAGVVAIAAVIAAAVCAVIFGVRAYDVYFDQEPAQAAREESVAAAEQAMLNVTTIDPRELDAWSERIEASFTGEALEQVQQQVAARLDPALEQAGDQAGTTTARLLRSSPTQVNADEGKAQVLVYLSVSGERPEQASLTQTMGFLVDMSKTDDLWKAEKVAALDSFALETPEAAAPAPQGGGN